MSEPDPLATLLSRALGTEVRDARRELLAGDEVEIERVRFAADGVERSLVFKRVPKERALEVELLPFLARKSDRVPVVHARGIPPPAVPAKRWLLIEDLVEAPSACDRDPRDIVLAKVAVEQAVARDEPALRALGAPVRTPAALAERVGTDEARSAAERLSGWPLALVHGDLVCANARATQRGVVVAEWSHAYLGCALLDVVRLTADLVAHDDATRGIGLSRAYGAAIGRVIGTDELRAAELLERAVRRLDG